MAKGSVKMPSKYGNRRTYSALCGRWFASKAEARRGEDLCLLQKGGQISGLEYQPKYKLCDKPRITFSADFRFVENGQTVVEDVKGFLTRECRVKIAWAEFQYGMKVRLVTATGEDWHK